MSTQANHSQHSQHSQLETDSIVAPLAHQCVQLVQHGQHQLQLVSWLSEVDEDILAQQLLTNLIVTAPAGGQQKYDNVRGGRTTRY
jgi:hypothetical protein